MCCRCMMDYLMIDGVAVISLSYVMTLSMPEHKLPNQRPTSPLLEVTSIASVVGQPSSHQLPPFLTEEAGHFWYSLSDLIRARAPIRKLTWE